MMVLARTTAAEDSHYHEKPYAVITFNKVILLYGRNKFHLLE
jgi:hypothetical protein